METQESMEREINLMELFWELLLGWRKIICFAGIDILLIPFLKTEYEYIFCDGQLDFDRINALHLLLHKNH